MQRRRLETLAGRRANAQKRQEARAVCALCICPTPRTMTNVCPSCTQGFRLPGEPSGQYVDLGGQPAYFVAGTGEANSKAILMFPDAFGLDMPNTQLIGDILSKEIGVDVFVLDMFHGQSEVMR